MENNKTALENHDTIYDVSNWTIFRKNFLAGIARSAGSWFFNILALVALAYILIPIFGPAIKQFVDKLPKNLNDIIIQIEKK